MIKFEDTSILSSYIKELLHTFNLPTLKIYTEDTKLYDNSFYIKDNYIVEYKNKEFKKIKPYFENANILHYTKNLKLNNIIYDSHTHEYLGEYLRFLKDYKKLDLMSMYNCFSNNVVNGINFDKEIIQNTGSSVSYFLKNKSYTWNILNKFIWDSTKLGKFTNWNRYGLKIDNIEIIKANSYIKNTSLNLNLDYSFIGFIIYEKRPNVKAFKFIIYDHKNNIAYEDFQGTLTFNYLENDFDLLIPNPNKIYTYEYFTCNSSVKIYRNVLLDFSTEDNNYKIYMIPVKFFKDYTIAISSNAKYELICGFYGKGLLKPDLNSEKLSEVNNKLNDALWNLKSITYRSISCSSFESPFIYSGLNPKNNSLIEQLNDPVLRDREQDLKLFIKLPLNCNSSIVILEGNYLNSNDRTINKNYFVDTENDNQVYFYIDGNYKKRYLTINNEGYTVERVSYGPDAPIADYSYDNGTRDKWENNRSIVNFKENYYKDSSSTFITNKNVQWTESVSEDEHYTVNKKTPKLENQYFTLSKDNTNIDKIKLISNLQLLNFNSGISYPFADRLVEYLCDNAVTNIDNISDNILRLQEMLLNRYKNNLKDNYPIKYGIKNYSYAGIWDDKYKGVLYSIADQEGLLNSKHDIIGYLDKDLENKLGTDPDIYKQGE